MTPYLRQMSALAVLALTGLSAAIGSAAVALPSTAPCITAGEADVVALSMQWSTALAAGRIDDAVALYAEDAVLISESSSEPISGRAQIRTYLAALASRHPRTLLTKRTIMSRCGIATELTTARFQVTGRRKGTRMFIGGSTSTVYAHDGTEWRIVQQSLPTMTLPNRAH